MSSNNAFKPVDKSETAELLLKHVSSYHNLIEGEIQRLNKSMLDMTEFFTKIWADDRGNSTQELSVMTHELNNKTIKTKHPIIFQYAEENQMDFEKNMTEIEIATSSIYPIVENMQKEIFSTLRPTPNLPNAGGNNISVSVPQPEKRSFWQFGKREQRPENVTDINQYTRSINLIDETLQVPVYLTKLKDFQHHGISRCQNLYYNDITTQRYYLLIERKFFHTMVKPKIQQIVDEARRLKIMREKEIIAPILADARSMAERRDMQPQIGPPR